MGVIAAACPGLGVDACCPGVGVARVVGHAGQRGAQSVVAGPAERDGLGLARGVGDWRDAGLCSQVFVTVEALAHAAQLGQDLRGADAPSAREAHQDAAIVDGADVVLDPAGEQPDLIDKTIKGACQTERQLALGLHLQFAHSDGRCLVQPIQQFLRAAPAAVGVLGAERGHALGPQAGRGLRRGVAQDEGQADGRVHVSEDLSSAGPEGLQQAAQLVGQLHAGGHQVIAPAHQGAQRADVVALRRQRLEAVAVGAQQVGQQVGVTGVALAAVAAVARSGGLDDVGVDRDDREASLQQRIDDQTRGALDGHSSDPCATQATAQLGQAGGIVIDLELQMHAAVLVDDTSSVGSAGPVQPGKANAHGQTPASCGMTCRVGRPGGSLTDRRSWLLTLALHPVARLGLPAPRGLRVSCGPSSGQRSGQSPWGHGSRNETSAQRMRRVKNLTGQHLCAEHGLPTAAFGRFVASADRPPPWTTLRCAMPTSLNSRKVVQ